MAWVYMNLIEAGLWTVDRVPAIFLERTKAEAKQRGVYEKYFEAENEGDEVESKAEDSQ